MKKIDVVEVISRKQLNDFIRVTYGIYQNIPQYVPDLENDIRDLFDQRKNTAYTFSQIQPFVAYQDNIPVGRIVGIINNKANKKWQTQCVRFSLIEFIDDPNVSKALLEAVATWGRSHGMNTIQGPMGITDFDKEGMLVEDFHFMGSMNTIYNPDYYPRHLEALGFTKEVDWIQIRVRIPEAIPERFSRAAHYVKERMGLQAIKVTNKDIMNGYGRKIFDLLNKAYQPLFGFSELSASQIDEFVKKYIVLVDKQLMTVVVNQQQEVVGVAITMASLSQALRKANGRLWPIGWWHLLKALRWRHEDNVEMLLIAVHPDLQGKGVNALFFDDLIPIYNKYGFQWAETGPQLEDNMRELSQWKLLNPEFVKRRRCYTKKLINDKT